MDHFNTIQIGNIESVTLENGLSIYIKENHKAPTVNVKLWVKTGSIHEEKHTGYGLSHFLEHMVFQGTKEFSATNLINNVTAKGGDINAYTSFEQTVYYINTLSENIFDAVNILLQLCTAPLFPEKGFKKEKEIILRERAMSADNPDRMLGEKLWLDLFKKHPARHPIIGYSENIKSVNRDMMIDYFKKRYALNRMFFVITGDVNAKDIIDFIAKKTSNLPMGEFSEIIIPKENEQCITRYGHTYFDDPVPRIALGFKIPGFTHKSFPALKMLAFILGGARTSRLIHKLRDTEQIALDIDAFTYPFTDYSVFAVTASCENNLRHKLFDSIIREIALISQNISEEELMRAKKQELLRTAEKLRSNSRLSSAIGNSVFYFDSPDLALGLIDNIMNLTVKDISCAAEKYLNMIKSTYTEIIPPDSTPLKKLLNKKKNIINNNLYKPEFTTLQKNNLRLLHIKDNSLPVVDISVIMPGGVFFENIENSGITKITAALLMTGTESYSEKKLAELMDNNAVSISSSGGNNTLSLKIKCPSDSLQIASELVRSILNESLFELDKLNRERHIAAESIKSKLMNPQKVAEEKLNKIMYGTHPYAKPMSGTIETLNRLTTESVRNFYNSVCKTPSKCVIGIAGDISKENAVKFAENLFSAENSADSFPDISFKHPEFPKSLPVTKISLPKEQAVVYMGVPGSSNLSEDRFPLDIIQTALNGMDTRLFNKIREKEGLAYYTGVYLSRGFHEGLIAFYAGTNQQNYEKVISLFRKEKKNLMKGGLTQEEFHNALMRNKCMQADAEVNIAFMIASSALSEYYGNGYLEPWEQMEKFSSLTKNDINAILKKYMEKEEIIVVAGNI